MRDGGNRRQEPAKLYPRPSAPCLSCTRPIRPRGFARHRRPEGIAGFVSRAVAGSSGAKVPISHRPNRQASALKHRTEKWNALFGQIRCGNEKLDCRVSAGRAAIQMASKRSGPRYPCTEPGSASSWLLDTIDIDTQPSTANAARLRASLGCKTPQPCRHRPGQGFWRIISGQQGSSAGRVASGAHPVVIFSARPPATRPCGRRTSR